MAQHTAIRWRGIGFAAARMAHRYPAQPAAIAVAVLVITAALTRVGWSLPFHYAAPISVLALVGLTGWWVMRFVARHTPPPP